MDVPITITAGTLPSGAVYNPQTYFNAIVARMSASISGGSILWGQIGGSQPGAQLPGNGLWFGSPFSGVAYWNAWDSAAGKYNAIDCVCGTSSHITQFVCGATSANTVLTTPNKSGTLALLEDLTRLFGNLAIANPSSVNIDWNNPVPVFIAMGQNLSINNINNRNGGTMDIFLGNASGNPATVYTLSTSDISWPGGTVPTLSSGRSGAKVVDHIRLYQVSGQIFGEIVKDFRY